MGKGLAYKREQREKHINRKKHILRSYQLDNRPHKYDSSINWGDITYSPFADGHEGMWKPYWTVKYLGQLNKGKIHCSCGMCMSKTRNKSRRHISGNYAPSINYKISEFRKIEKMDYDESNWASEKKELLLDELFDSKYSYLKDKISEEEYNYLKESYIMEV